MKKSLFIFMLFAWTYSSQALETYIPEVASIHQFDKTTMINKKMRSAQESISKGDYQSAITTLNSLLKLSPNHSKAKEMLEQCKEGVLRQKEKEEREYNDACRTGMVESLHNFISRYPKSEYVRFAKERIDDYSIWEIAKKRNTIDSYNLYLQKSSVQAYKEDAHAAIREIEAAQAWSVCETTEDESLLSDYISTHPESENVKEANYRLNLLKGERMYKDGFTDVAYTYLSEANQYRALMGDAARHYADIKEKKLFNEMLASSDIDKVRKYLNTLNLSSPYYNDMSNHLALLLGAKLSAWSSEYKMNEALAFAKDKPTKSTVKRYISQAKDQHHAYERQRKAKARKAWWKGRVTLGWNVFNLGTTLSDKDARQSHIGTGLRLRFGRYSDVLNIIIGADYQYNLLILDDYRRSDFGVHQGVGIANLRFNLCNAFAKSKFYIGCAGDFCFVSSGKDISDDALKRSPIAIEPQIGIQGKGLDFGIYYRTFTYTNGIFKYKVVDNNHGGCFFTWYF